MNDRQRLEAIVAVVCKYLPPNGISREEAMSQIIGLVDPLPEKEWVSLTDEEIDELELPDTPTVRSFIRFIEAALRSKNT